MLLLISWSFMAFNTFGDLESTMGSGWRSCLTSSQGGWSSSPCSSVTSRYSWSSCVRKRVVGTQPVWPHHLQRQHEATGKHAKVRILLLPEDATVDIQRSIGTNPAARDCHSIWPQGRLHLFLTMNQALRWLHLLSLQCLNKSCARRLVKDNWRLMWCLLASIERIQIVVGKGINVKHIPLAKYLNWWLPLKKTSC